MCNLSNFRIFLLFGCFCANGAAKMAVKTNGLKCSVYIVCIVHEKKIEQRAFVNENPTNRPTQPMTPATQYREREKACLIV